MNNLINVNTNIENLNKQIIIANKLLQESAAIANSQQNNVGDSNREVELKNLLKMVQDRMTAIGKNSDDVWAAVRNSETYQNDDIWIALKVVMRVAAVREALREPGAYKKDGKELVSWEGTRIAALQMELPMAELQVAKLHENVREKALAISLPEAKIRLILKAEMNIVKTRAILKVTELQVEAWRK